MVPLHLDSESRFVPN